MAAQDYHEIDLAALNFHVFSNCFLAPWTAAMPTRIFEVIRLARIKV